MSTWSDESSPTGGPGGEHTAGHSVFDGEPAGDPSGVRRTSRRDRRDRGMRGPAFGAGGLGGRVPADLSARERFDRIAVEVVSEIEALWPDQLAAVELAVEDVPVVPRSWVAPRVPLASFVEASASTPPRLVLFRRPIEHRARTQPDLAALVLTVVSEQLADYLGVPPEDVHPDYEV